LGNVNTENYLSGLADVRIYVKVRVRDLRLRIGFGDGYNSKL